MKYLNVIFTDGRVMQLEPAITFTGTDLETQKELEYICFTDYKARKTIWGEKLYTYYFKLDEQCGRIILFDNDSEEERTFVSETLGKAYGCAAKGWLCPFELVRGGLRSISFD